VAVALVTVALVAQATDRHHAESDAAQPEREDVDVHEWQKAVDTAPSAMTDRL
jgi:hypothetical protein